MAPSSSLNLRPETRTALDAIAQAMELTRQRTGADTITNKVGRDVVTATDVSVEDTIRKLLTEALGLNVIGEERGGEDPSDGSAYWLVDPICGARPS